MEPIKLIIAYSGCARVGKTTAAEYTQKYIEKNYSSFCVHRMSFAQPLKEGLSTMGIEKGALPELYRDMAQKIGTDMLRKYDNNWWINLMRKNITETRGGPSVFIIDDARFPNEVELVKSFDNSYNSYNVFVYGSKSRVDLSLNTYKHESEHMSTFFEQAIRGEETGGYPNGASMDRVLENVGSLKNLENRVESLINEIMTEVLQ